MKQLKGLQITSRSLEITNYNLDNCYTLVDAWEVSLSVLSHLFDI